MKAKGNPIGVFDSGFGGLTVLKQLVKTLPQYDYLYLGDNARAPYGSRSFDVVYNYTLQCVEWFFKKGCSLVIIACNTASAKALRTIQQNDLPKISNQNRVLGVIRPTAEIIGKYSKTNAIGILGTAGTIQSESYLIEINKFFPRIKVFQQACPLLAPLIEYDEYDNAGANYFVKKYLDELMQQSNDIDTILLACTHYPLLLNKFRQLTNGKIKIISQGEVVAQSLRDYLNRHPEIEMKCSKTKKLEFFTTDDPNYFDKHGKAFFGKQIQSKHVSLQ